MKNNTFNKTIGGLFGKMLAIAFFTAILSVASFAQSNNLFYQNGGAFFGRVTVFPSHFQIETNGTVIKTFSNSCKSIPNNGLLCTFGQFRDGRHIYSGQGQFFQNGTVILRWTNENSGGTVWREMDSGWIGFIPK